MDDDGPPTTLQCYSIQLMFRLSPSGRWGLVPAGPVVEDSYAVKGVSSLSSRVQSRPLQFSPIPHPSERIPTFPQDPRPSPSEPGPGGSKGLSFQRKTPRTRSRRRSVDPERTAGPNEGPSRVLSSPEGKDRPLVQESSLCPSPIVLSKGMVLYALATKHGCRKLFVKDLGTETRLNDK